MGSTDTHTLKVNNRGSALAQWQRQIKKVGVDGPSRTIYLWVMANPKTGYYECPRCNGRNAYESEETTGAMAVTLNTDNPVDPTLIRSTTGIVMRCKECGEKTKWFDSAETKAYKSKRAAKASTVICYFGGAAFLFGGFYILNAGISGTTGLAIGTFVASAIFLFMGYVSSQG